MNPPKDDLREDRKDFLWRMYEESRTHQRHYQSERATASNIILVTSVGVIGLIARKPLVCDDWPLTCGLMVIGAYGTLFMVNLFACIDRCKRRGAKYLKDLRALVGIAESSDSEDLPKAETPVGVWSLGFADKLRVLWPFTITLIGTAATIYLAYLGLRGKC